MGISTTCRHCPNRMGCQRHGCYAFNEDAKAKIEADEKRLDELPQPYNQSDWFNYRP